MGINHAYLQMLPVAALTKRVNSNPTDPHGKGFIIGMIFAVFFGLCTIFMIIRMMVTQSHTSNEPTQPDEDGGPGLRARLRQLMAFLKSLRHRGSRLQRRRDVEQGHELQNLSPHASTQGQAAALPQIPPQAHVRVPATSRMRTERLVAPRTCVISREPVCIHIEDIRAASAKHQIRPAESILGERLAKEMRVEERVKENIRTFMIGARAQSAVPRM